MKAESKPTVYVTLSEPLLLYYARENRLDDCLQSTYEAATDPAHPRHHAAASRLMDCLEVFYRPDYGLLLNRQDTAQARAWAEQWAELHPLASTVAIEQLESAALTS